MAKRRRRASNGGGAGLVIIGWIVFAILVIVSPDTLHDYWEWVGEQDLWLKVIMWVVTLPWLVGQAIRESSWDGWARTLAVFGVAILSIILATPRTYQRTGS